MKNEDPKVHIGLANRRIPAFTLTPPPRCCTPEKSRAAGICGELATRRRPGNRWFADTFHCNEHAHETDVSIAGDFALRRVRLTCEVLLAGIDVNDPIARAEAVARLEAAVQGVGGILDLREVSSAVGLYQGYAGGPVAPTPAGKLL